MGNLVWSVIPESHYDGPRAIVKIKAVNEELQGKIKGLIEEAVAEGVIRARREAPRGPRHSGPRIMDSVFAEPIRYHPGGAGGGGFFEGSFKASSEITPHLAWVFRGTGEHGPRAQLITPRYKKAMMTEWWGDGKTFFKSSKGQFPQQRWWTDAEERATRVLSTSIRHLDLDLPE